jgi:t-SNARE complex subunit (syntaxin)
LTWLCQGSEEAIPMSDLDQAVATQLANIEKRTGRSIHDLAVLLRASGLAKHGEQVAMLKRELGMGHGDANLLAHHVRKLDAAAAGQGGPETPADAVEALYSGTKAHLRPIHDKLMAAIRKFGEFEQAPKKTYVSLRRKKQFAMIGPATNTQVEVGINLKDVQPTGGLVALPPKSMCDYKIRLASVDDVSKELLGWIRKAFDAAG